MPGREVYVSADDVRTGTTEAAPPPVIVSDVGRARKPLWSHDYDRASPLLPKGGGTPMCCPHYQLRTVRAPAFVWHAGALASKCPACGSHPPPGAAFCDHCGTPLTATTTAAPSALARRSQTPMVRRRMVNNLRREGRTAYRCLDRNSFTTCSKPRGLSRKTWWSACGTSASSRVGHCAWASAMS